VAILFAATTGKLDDVPTPRVKDFETGFYRFLEAESPKVLQELASKNELTDELAKALTAALDSFRETFLVDDRPAKAAPPASGTPAPGPSGSKPPAAGASASPADAGTAASTDAASTDAASTDAASGKAAEGKAASDEPAAGA